MSRLRSRFFTAPGKVLAAVLAAAGFVLFMTTSALSQGPPVCSPRDHLLSWLQENYGEVPVGVGVANGSLVELLTSEDGITWTIILTSPDGISCMMTGGEAWRDIQTPPKGPAV